MTEVSQFILMSLRLYDRQIDNQSMILGHFPASTLPLVGSLAGIISIILCYYIAVGLGHEQPLPHTYISNTARHYPQFIIFRIGTITASVPSIMAYFVNHFWLHWVAGQIGYPLYKLRPGVMLCFGVVGILGLFGSTATIDTGHMNMKWHTHCAGIFFICTIVYTLYNTFICYRIYANEGSKRGKITRVSMWLKVGISALLLYQIYLSATKTSGLFTRENDSDLGHWLEYTLAFTLLANNLTLAYDFKGFSMAYLESK